jgi:RNA polymerase sigma-70 factor (ECF subfamily)
MQTNNTSHFKKKSTEQILLQQINQGEQSAFWELWEQHKDYLYNHCLRWMNNNSVEAEEAMSFSMLRAWEKLPKHAFKITNVRAWLTRITYNLCIDIHRQKAGKLSIGESIESLIIKNEDLLPSTIDSPEAAILRRELRIVLYHLIKNLPKNLQIPVILRFIEGKTYREISDLINIPENNVRKRIQKGRILLKQSINQYLEGAINFQPLEKREYEDNIFSLCNFQINQSTRFNSNFPHREEHNLETLVYRLSATHLETLPHRRSSLNYSLNCY